MHRSTAILSLAAAALFLGGCAQKKETPMSSSITKAPFGQTEAGQPIELYTLKNASGMEAGIINFGGIVVSLKVPGRGGQIADVVLGFDKLADYVKPNPYFGAIVGRYGNRIAKGRFTLNGVEYKLAHQRRPELAARRHQRLRPGGVAGARSAGRAIRRWS